MQQNPLRSFGPRLQQTSVRVQTLWEIKDSPAGPARRLTVMSVRSERRDFGRYSDRLMDERSLRRWADAYAKAWEQGDADAVVELFTPDASYRSLIFDDPHSGADGIRAYWERATATQSSVRVWMGDPLVDGDRAALEWWAVMVDDSVITLPGCLLLDFDADRCARLNEYWHVESAIVQPYEGWGRVAEGDTETTRAAAAQWTRAWKQGWEALDPSPIVAAYEPDAVHRSAPLRDPEAGGIAGYLDRCFPDEGNVKARFGVWAVSGANALTVYKATLNDESEGGEVTIAGCDMLRFSDEGLCVEQRDYWNAAPGWAPDDRSWPL
ncbi:MAG: nuclear transport factor 2 family protein [Actinobacteria bacterium]|nr:nuclear transport factor 2 family protein [Actinomycetota bacterium]